MLKKSVKDLEEELKKQLNRFPGSELSKLEKIFRPVLKHMALQERSIDKFLAMHERLEAKVARVTQKKNK